jgi:hypothetical protein
MWDPMASADTNREASLASLSEINCSLRQQVVDLALSIAVMKESAGLRSSLIIHGINGASTKARTAKSKTTGQRQIKRYDRRS